MVNVSVLLPSYNHEKFISETIESVLNQTFRDFEFIIIDDCSNDNSREIIKNYKNQDERIKLFFHQKNKGISKTENELLSLANGKYVAFLNSDDVWDVKKLEKQLKILEKDENLVVWTEGEMIDENSQFTGKFFTQFYTEKSIFKNKKKSGRILTSLLYDNYILFASLIFKKENLKDLRFNEKFNIINDYQLEVALAKDYKYYFIEEPLVKYRLHSYNTIYSNQIPIKKEYVQISRLFIEKYGDFMTNEIKFHLYKRILSLSISLSYKLSIFTKMYNPFKIDVFGFLFNLKNEEKVLINVLINEQKLRIYQSLKHIFSISFKKFIIALSIVIKFKKLSKSLKFWANLIFYYLLKEKITYLKNQLNR